MNKKYIIFIFVLSTAIVFGFHGKIASAQSQTSQSMLYVPLIGITSVPDPLTLPSGGGKVTYNYAVRNFLQGVPLTNIGVADDVCSPVTFVTGDDNNNGELDYNETWRYSCATQIYSTTADSATVTGTENNITARHTAYTTVLVGSTNPPPIVSIVNITKVAYPLSLPIGGGNITYTYKVNNPGVVPLGEVTVIDDKCHAMSGQLGDTNGNGLLDTDEVWTYTCRMNLTQTTTNTVTVTASASNLWATDSFSLTVKVKIPTASSTPNFPNTGTSPDLTTIVWEVLGGVLGLLIILLFFTRRIKDVITPDMMPNFFRKK